jgi:hypothetical protein
MPNIKFPDYIPDGANLGIKPYDIRSDYIPSTQQESKEEIVQKEETKEEIKNEVVKKPKRRIIGE